MESSLHFKFIPLHLSGKITLWNETCSPTSSSSRPKISTHSVKVELSFSIEIIVYDDKHAFYKVNLSALTAEASLTNILYEINAFASIAIIQKQNATIMYSKVDCRPSFVNIFNQVVSLNKAEDKENQFIKHFNNWSLQRSI